MHDPGVQKGKQGGFTLVELMVVVAVIAIIGAIAAPNMSQMVRRSRLASAANEMAIAMQAARMEAVSRQHTVAVCPTSNGTACTNTTSARWLIRDENGTVYREFQMPTGITVKASPNASGFKFSFNPSGFSKVGANLVGSLRLCGSNITGENAVDVTAAAGRVSSTRVSATSACTAPTAN